MIGSSLKAMKITKIEKDKLISLTNRKQKSYNKTISATFANNELERKSANVNFFVNLTTTGKKRVYFMLLSFRYKFKIDMFYNDLEIASNNKLHHIIVPLTDHYDVISIDIPTSKIKIPKD